MRTSKNHHAEQVLKAAEHLCKTKGISMWGSESRRGSDLLQLSFWGDRQEVLKIPFALLDYLNYKDIEILRSGRRGQDYLLVLAITEQIWQHEMQEPERRKKLVRRLHPTLAGI